MPIGYASMLRLLAEQQLAIRLTIAPEFVFSASEVLTNLDPRKLANIAWGRPPHNVYGATESSGIAAECGQHPGMHLFEDLVYHPEGRRREQPADATRGCTGPRCWSPCCSRAPCR